jgi:transposase
MERSAVSLRFFPLPGAIFLINLIRVPGMDITSQEANLIGAAHDTLEPRPVAALPPAEPRLRRADRAQILLRPCALEDLLPPDHPARTVWELVCRWDLRGFLAKIRARGETPGRPATDPRIMVSLWLFAYTQGVSSGRELHRLCEEHDAYRWICGGVSVNSHMLTNFRVNHEAALDDLLTQMIAALINKDLVSVERVASDGTRVRAGAGRNSFKTAEKLQECLKEAIAHVEALKQQAEDPAMPLKRKKAIERGARERVQRIEQAIEENKKVQEAKAQQKEKASKHQPAKTSTTDPLARQMHMPDGGKAPGFNVQFGVDTGSRAIVGVDVTNAGSDVHESQPMREQVEERTEKKVLEHLVDGGYVGLESIEQSAAAGTAIYAPVPKPRKEGADRYQPKKTDSEPVGEWRQRMGTPEAKAIYKERASTVETVNAECKTYRSLERILVRGINKVRCVALWSALAYNFVHLAKHLVT